MAKESELLRQAEEAAVTAESWADLSNWLFDPATGLVARAFPGKAERAAFARTEEYRRIRELIRDAQNQSGLVKGATPRKGGWQIH